MSGGTPTYGGEGTHLNAAIPHGETCRWLPAPFPTTEEIINEQLKCDLGRIA